MKCSCFFSLIMAIAGSCSNEVNCNDSSLYTAIIAKWKVVAIGISAVEVEFKDDGTLVDPPEAVLSGKINGIPLDQKSKTIESET